MHGVGPISPVDNPQPPLEPRHFVGMTFESLSPTWTDHPLTDPELTTNVIDLMLSPGDRHHGTLAVILCTPTNHYQATLTIALPPTYLTEHPPPPQHPPKSPPLHPTDHLSAQPTNSPPEHPSDRPLDQPPAHPTEHPAEQPATYPTERPAEQSAARPRERTAERPNMSPPAQPTERLAKRLLGNSAERSTTRNPAERSTSPAIGVAGTTPDHTRKTPSSVPFQRPTTTCGSRCEHGRHAHATPPADVCSTALSAIIPAVRTAPGTGLILALGRSGPPRWPDLDDQWAKAAIAICQAADIRLLGFYVATQTATYQPAASEPLAA